MKTHLSSFTLLAFVFAVCVRPAFAQEHEVVDRWTPALSMQFHTISQTAISPDGRHVAFVVRKPIMEGEKSEYRSHIWMVETTGSEPFQFTHGEKSSTSPRFSPDGQYLSFESSRSGKNQVWMMRIRGGEAEQITDAKKGVSGHQWAPDGSHIAYLMRDPDTEDEEKAKKEKRDVILVDKNFKNNHIYTIPVMRDAEGERPSRQITAGAFHVTAFDWSPDSQTFAFSHQPDPRINTARSGPDISKVSSSGDEITPLVTRDGADRNPVFSPDGQWIAFATHGGKPEDVGLADINIVPSNGGTIVPLPHSPDRNANLLGWSPKGDAVYIAEAMHTTRELIELPLKGEPSVLFPMEGVKGAPSYTASGSAMAFTYENSDTPADVYLAGEGGEKKIEKLTDIHAGVPRPPMGKTTVLTWTSPDGTPVEGLLTYPIDYDPGRQYPLVLNIHGGPAGVYTQSFSGRAGIYMYQTFAQKGMAVLRPNPRGSTGYGKDFRYANVMDWGYGDYEDVISGVDKVIEMGIAHPDSLSVMGWSYGGYLTSFLVTRTERFKAASMGAGLPNLISMITTTDIQDYLAAHMGGEFWDDYEQYEKHSAIYHIKNVSTPTQVIHGAEDLRVPFTQGQEFYRALDRLGVKTEMIVYPRTPHGPREPKFLMDVTPRILKWFEHHLERTSEGEVTEPSSLEE